MSLQAATGLVGAQPFHLAYRSSHAGEGCTSVWKPLLFLVDAGLLTVLCHRNIRVTVVVRKSGSVRTRPPTSASGVRTSRENSGRRFPWLRSVSVRPSYRRSFLIWHPSRQTHRGQPPGDELSEVVDLRGGHQHREEQVPRHRRPRGQIDRVVGGQEACSGEEFHQELADCVRIGVLAQVTLVDCSAGQELVGGYPGREGVRL